jgi:redox-sensitive bicupin YhaK (pirin superfamily)
MAVRVVLGEISAKDATTRAAIPSAGLPRWPPFERVAETIATPRRRFPLHRHEGCEVLTYVIEGSGSYEFGNDPPRTLSAGATHLLTASTNVAHAINPGKGQTIRWFAVVAALPPGSTAPVRVQSTHVRPGPGSTDGTAVRRLVGPGSGIESSVGIECELIEFPSNGTTFRRVGHDRIAIAYTLSGRGSVDNQTVDAGEAALVDDAAGVAIGGRAGLRLMLTTAPRSA